MTQRGANPNKNWKIIAYAIGLGGGALFGGLVALLYTRTAESTLSKQGTLPRVNSMSLIGLTISLISLMRQIVDLGTED